MEYGKGLARKPSKSNFPILKKKRLSPIMTRNQTTQDGPATMRQSGDAGTMTGGNLVTMQRPSVEETYSDERYVKTDDSPTAEGRRGLHRDMVAYNDAADQNIVELEDIRQR